MKILECSSRGDKRFSALYAKVKILNREDTIENHYQRCKKFKDPLIKKAKGKTPDYIIIKNKVLTVDYLTPYYKLLWLIYLDENPDLVNYARQFDDYNDMFKGKSVNCQADVIRQYIKEGRESILKECEDLISILNE